MATDLGQQAELQKTISGILAERTKILEVQEKQLSRQLELLDAMREKAGKGLKQAAGSTNSLAAATDAAADAADKAKKSQGEFNVTLEDGKKKADEMSGSMESLGNFGAALGDSLTSATTGTIGLIKGIGSMIASFAQLGFAIISLPFKLWDAFIEKSMSMPYNPAFRQMMEDVREMFGSLKAGAGKEVMDGYRELRSEMSAIGKETGLSMRRIFGFGVEGRAAMLGFIKDMSQGLGSRLGPVMEQIGSDIARVTYAIKGMGLSSEESGAAMKFFYDSGQNASKMLQEMGKTAAMMAKQSGFNIKTLSKAMVETINVFPQFAKGGVQAMAKVAHYTHNLGIEVKDLQAVFDKFDSFDQAAESASQLSQAFGVNVDAMKMVKEQDPTKRLEQLRNAFKAAGKDINTMTSAERKLAEATTGLSGAAFEAAMGEGSKKKALSESEKAAKSASLAARDQTKAMKELADSIKRIIPPPVEKYKGFFDAFSKGFSEGMFYSENMRKMFVNLQMTFRQAYLFGWRLARLLFDSFPGMDKLATGFAKIFNPAKYREMFNKVLNEFEAFFLKAQKDPKAGMKTLVENIKNIFKNMFGGSGGALESIKSGFKTILSTLGVIMGEGLSMLLSMMAEGMKNLAGYIANPEQFTAALGDAGSVASSFFSPLLEALTKMGPALGDAFINLLSVAFEKVKPYLYIAAGALATFWAAKFAASMALGIIGIVAPIVLKAIFTGLVTKLRPAAAIPTPPGTQRALGAGEGIGKSIESTVQTFAKIPPGTILKAAGVMLLIALTLTAAIAIMMFGFIGMVIHIQKMNLNMGSIVKFGALMGIMTITLLGLTPLIVALGVLSKFGFGPKEAAIVALTIAAIGLAVTAVGGIAIAMLAVVADSLTPATVGRMIDISKAFSIFTEGLVNIGKAVMFFALASLNPFTIGSTIANMAAIVGIMVLALPDMVKKTMEAMSGYSPDEVFKKMQAINSLVGALSPMFEVSSNLSKAVEEMADEDISGPEIRRVLTKLGETFEVIVTNVTGLVTTIVNQAKDLSDEGLKRVEAVGNMLGPVASVLGALLKPMNDIMELSRDRALFSGNAEELDTVAFGKNMKAMSNGMKDLVPGLTSLMGKGGPIAALLDVINSMGVTLQPPQIESMKVFAETTKSVVEAVRFFIDSFASVTKEDGKPPNMSMMAGLIDTLTQIRGVLFGSENGFMTGIIKDLMDPTKFPINPADAGMLKKKAAIIETLLKPVKSLVGIMKDVPPPFVPGPITGLFASLKTALFGEEDTLADLLKAIKKSLTTVTITKDDATKLNSLKPLFSSLSSLSSAAKTLGEAPIDFKNVDHNLMSFSDLLNSDKAGRGSLRYFIDTVLSDDKLANVLGGKNVAKIEAGLSKVKSIIQKMSEISEMTTGMIDSTKTGAVGPFTKLANDITAADNILLGKLSNDSKIGQVINNVGKKTKIDVTHNIRGVELHVNVTLDTGELAQKMAPKMIRVDLDKDVVKGSRVITVGTGPQDSTLRER